MKSSEALENSLKELQKYGMLLMSDPTLPSLVSIIVGQPLKSSWWGHRLGHTIFAVASKLEEHPDVTVTKFLGGKVTFVHKNLWPELYAIGLDCEKHSLEKASKEARELFQLVKKKGEIRTNKVTDTMKGKTSKAVKELESKLVIATREIHTESGAHAKIIESWSHWAHRNSVPKKRINPSVAIKKIEDILRSMTSKDISRYLLWGSAQST